jgi:hypothetical protein
MEGPSWAQNQKIQMVKDALKRKSISISREFGEPLEFPINDESSAVKAIQLLGYDPQLFSRELADAYGLKQANLTMPGNITKPEYVPQKIWDSASEQEKIEFLNKIGK